MKFKNLYLSDKYYRSLDDYNKVTSLYKTNFFMGYQDFDFRSFLTSLSFNLNINTKNYRWGQRFFNKSIKDFQWITSNKDKEIQKDFWNPLYGCPDSKMVKAFFYTSDIKNHFLACDKQQRMLNYIYKLSKEEKEEIKDYRNAFINMNNVNKKTFGSSQQLNSDILLVDIDNYEERHAVETLGMFLDEINLKVKDLLFIEQNAFTGGIHIAIHLPHKITNTEFYPLLMKKMAEKDIRIECNFINSILRFPLSYEYVAIKHTENIFNFDEFIPESLWEKTFTDYLNNLNDDIANSDYLNNLIIETHKELQGFNVWDNYWKIKKHLFQKIKTIQSQGLDIYKLKYANRYDQMSKIVPYAKINGNSLDETVDLIIANNINSKDLTKWSRDKLKHNIEKFYNNCPSAATVVVKKYSNTYISNEKLVPEITKQFLNNELFVKHFTDKFIQNYMNERNKHNNSFKSFSKEKIEIFHKEIPLFLKEIIGLMFYSINSDKKYINDDYNKYLGFQLSDSTLIAMQDRIISELELTSSLAKTSIQYLKKALLKTLNLQEIKYNRKKNWMLGSCRAFYIKKLNDIYNCLDHLYRSTFSELFSNRFLNNFSDMELSLIILYISLVENSMIVNGDYLDEIPRLKKLIETG